MNRYYKAFEIDVKPFIQWDCFANDESEYKELGLNRDALVLPEVAIPQNQYGVCPLKMDGKGGLIERSPSEMERYRVEYENEMQTVIFNNKISEINQATFNFNKHTCFMNETARLVYGLLENSSIDSFELKTLEGSLFLNSSDYSALIAAYKSELLRILNS